MIRVRIGRVSDPRFPGELFQIPAGLYNSIKDPWIDEYEAAEVILGNGIEPADSAETYRKKSKGD